jgi:hypothetical protein
MSDAGRAAGGPPGTSVALLPLTLGVYVARGHRRALVVAAGAFLTGPSVSAVKTRKASSPGLGWVRQAGPSASDSGPPVRSAPAIWDLPREGRQIS